jgi:hypothetical protein
MEKKRWRERTSWLFIAGAAGAAAFGLARQNEELVMGGYVVGCYEFAKFAGRFLGEGAIRTIRETVGQTTGQEERIEEQRTEIVVAPKVDEELVSEAESYVGFPVPTQDELRSLDRQIDQAWEEGRLDENSRNMQRFHQQVEAVESVLRSKW